MQNKDTRVILSSENVTPTELPILRNFKVWIMKLPQCNYECNYNLSLKFPTPHARSRVHHFKFSLEKTRGSAFAKDSHLRDRPQLFFYGVKLRRGAIAIIHT